MIILYENFLHCSKYFLSRVGYRFLGILLPGDTFFLVICPFFMKRLKRLGGLCGLFAFVCMMLSINI